MVHRSEILHPSHFNTYYQRALPSPALAPLVKEYWYLDNYRPLPQGVAEHFLPSLESRLVLPFDNRCVYQIPGQSPLEISGPHLVLPQARPLACLHPASQGILGLTLTPEGLAAFLAAFWAEEALSLPATGLLPLSGWHHWQAQLMACKDLGMQSRFLDQVLEQVLLTGFKRNPRAHCLSEALQHLESGWTIAETAAVLGLSARSLQRVFLQGLGYSPRTCFRVQRLRRTLGQFWQTPGRSIWDSEYCDYSHFYKEFKALMGQTPTAYMHQFSAG